MGQASPSRKTVRFAAVMAKVVVSRRNVEMTDFHRRNNIGSGHEMKEQPGVGPSQIIRRKENGALEYLHDDLTAAFEETVLALRGEGLVLSMGGD